MPERLSEGVGHLQTNGDGFFPDLYNKLQPPTSALITSLGLVGDC